MSPCILYEETMKRRYGNRLLAAALAALMLGGCTAAENGGAQENAKAPSGEASGGAGQEAASEEEEAADGGTVLNIYCWDAEFRHCLERYYPDYEKVDEETGRIGDVTVRFLVIPAEDGAYEERLDAVLAENEAAAPEEKADIFLVDSENAARYTAGETKRALKLSSLGIDGEELSSQYDFTQKVVTDENGAQRGAAWQACSAGLLYNRSLAEKALGTEDAAAVQEAVKDWSAFAQTADKVKQAGYRMTAGVYDTWRAYACAETGKAQSGGTQPGDSAGASASWLQSWVEDSMALLDKEETGTAMLWSREWNSGFYEDTQVFAYLGPLWFIRDAVHAGEEGTVAGAGGWGLVKGPASFFWGGTWICAAAGTDNKTLVKDIILTLTADQTVMKKMAEDETECVNNREVLAELAADEAFGMEALGGQNPYAVLAEAAESMEIRASFACPENPAEAFRDALTEKEKETVMQDPQKEAASSKNIADME